MMIPDRIQALIHKLEVEGGARWLNYVTLMVAVMALAVWYDTHCYVAFRSPEAMDAAQVARNARPQSAWPECAPDINRVAGGEGKNTESPHA